MEQETVPSPLLAWPGAIASADGIVAEHYGAPLPEGRALETGRAFVCRGMVCDAPTADAAALGAQLDAVQTAGA